MDEACVADMATPQLVHGVQRTLIRPPAARLGPVSDEERAETQRQSPVAGLYDHAIDSESAYEMLVERAEQDLKREEEERAKEAEIAHQREAAEGSQQEARAEAARRRANGREGEGRGPWGGGASVPQTRRTRTGFQIPDFGLGGDGRDDAADYDDRDDTPARRRAPRRTTRSSGYQRQTVTETIMKQVGRTVASTVTTAIVRGILGSFKRGR
ncbi:helicase HerA-like domain-containing protein [Jiella mangrovi]|nr:helicase HerA-like domain-containing protein [Jiella mangrovi]